MIEGAERDGLISPGDTIVEDAVIVTLAVDKRVQVPEREPVC